MSWALFVFELKETFQLSCRESLPEGILYVLDPQLQPFEFPSVTEIWIDVSEPFFSVCAPRN